MRIYKTLIRPVVVYGSETWTLTKSNERALRIFERKVIRRIWGAVREDDGWRMRSNREIEDILEREDIVRFIKSRRIDWLGHTKRMAENRMPKRILGETIIGGRGRGRPRRRWMQDVIEDLRKMRIAGWWQEAMNRQRWRQIVREAKVHPGL